MTKSEVTKRLNELKKANIIVINFSYNRYLPKSLKGFPDYLILKRRRVIFLELKLKETKDRLSAEQEQLMKKIKSFGFEYYIINENNINEIIDKILSD